MSNIKDKKTVCINAFIMFLINILILINSFLYPEQNTYLFSYIAFSAVTVLGIKKCHAGECLVLLLFGKYIGTVKKNGLIWVLPTTQCIKVPNHINMFNSKIVETVDSRNRSLSISIVMLWQIEDYAKVSLKIKNIEEFITYYTDSTLKNIATIDARSLNSKNNSIKNNLSVISEGLREELQNIFSVIGIKISNLKISTLYYSSSVEKAIQNQNNLKHDLEQKRILLKHTYAMVSDLMSNIEYPEAMKQQKIIDTQNIVLNMMKI